MITAQSRGSTPTTSRTPVSDHAVQVNHSPDPRRERRPIRTVENRGGDFRRPRGQNNAYNRGGFYGPGPGIMMPIKLSYINLQPQQC